MLMTVVTFRSQAIRDCTVPQANHAGHSYWKYLGPIMSSRAGLSLFLDLQAGSYCCGIGSVTALFPPAGTRWSLSFRVPVLLISGLTIRAGLVSLGLSAVACSSRKLCLRLVGSYRACNHCDQTLHFQWNLADYLQIWACYSIEECTHSVLKLKRIDCKVGLLCKPWGRRGVEASGPKVSVGAQITGFKAKDRPLKPA